MPTTTADACWPASERPFRPAPSRILDAGVSGTEDLAEPSDATRFAHTVLTLREPLRRPRRPRKGPVPAAGTPLGQLLAASSWMQGLSGSLRDRVVADAYETTHTQREVVARRDEPAHSWMGVGEGMLKLGAVAANGQAVRYSHIGRGGWIDEEWLALDQPRPYDVVAVTPARVIHVPADTYRLILRSSLEFNQFVIRQLSLAVARCREVIESDHLSDPVARLARVLVQLHDPSPVPHKPAWLPLSQKDLGELAGMTRQRTNSAIKTLEKLGVLSVRYGGLLMKDFSALQRCSSEKPG